MSNNGKRFILVFIDCATRYPEAVAIKNIDTTTIAEELVTILQSSRNSRWDAER